MRKFLLSTVVWTTLWTGVLVGLAAFAPSDGETAALGLQDALLLWSVVFGVVSFSKLVWLARRFGFNLGYQTVKGPTADVGDAIARAGKSALEGHWRPPAD